MLTVISGTKNFQIAKKKKLEILNGVQSRLKTSNAIYRNNLFIIFSTQLKCLVLFWKMYTKF